MAAAKNNSSVIVEVARVFITSKFEFHVVVHMVIH
jgi:hypothetical protein